MLEVLSNVAIASPEAAEYIENSIMEICSREKLSAEEVLYGCCFGLSMMIAYAFDITV